MVCAVQLKMVGFCVNARPATDAEYVISLDLTWEFINDLLLVFSFSPHAFL